MDVGYDDKTLVERVRDRKIEVQDVRKDLDEPHWYEPDHAEEVSLTICGIRPVRNQGVICGDEQDV